MDIYAEITDRILSQLEQGEIPWKKPWIGSASNCAISYATGRPYSLLNQMLLGRPGEYLTFNECRKAGSYVRKGEKAHMVVFWKWLSVDDEEKSEEKQIPLLRYYSVFHISQCEGVPVKRQTALAEHADPDENAERIARRYLEGSGPSVEQAQSDEAYYSPSHDTIHLPLIRQFREAAEYYSVAFHEMVHSTGHSSRLDRLTANAHFGNEEYSKEELVAEIGAAALVNAAGLETRGNFRNSAAYIQSWRRALKDDKRLIVSATGRAEKAVRFILGEV
jgi:antirestriction protein ArdC